MVSTVRDMVDDLRLRFEEKLQVKGKSFAVQLRKARRRLPHKVRRDAMFLEQSVDLAEHPKLARMVDPSRAKTAYQNVRDYLDSVDLAAARRDAALNLVASIAFAVLVTGILVLTVLVWRGFV